MEKFEKPYTEEEALEESSYLKKMAESGEANDYSEAERIVETERKVESIKKQINHPESMANLKCGDNFSSVYRSSLDVAEDQKNIFGSNNLTKLALCGDWYSTAEKKINTTGMNALIHGGDYYDLAYDDIKHKEDYNEEKGPQFKLKDSLKNALVIRGEEEDISGFPFIVPEDVMDKITQEIDSGKAVIDVLKEFEKKELIKIVNIPEFYTNEGALKEKYGIEFATKKELDEFLESDLGKSSSPKKILNRARYLDAGTIKFLLEKYQDDINLPEIISFGSDSIIQNLDKNDQLKILGTVISILEERTKDNIKENEDYTKQKMEKANKEGKTFWLMPGEFEPGLTGESQTNIDSRLSLLKSAAEQGLILPNFRERIKKIYESTNHYPSGYYSDIVINNQREDIEKTALLLEKLSGDKREIVGEGLEFISSEYGKNRQIYLDGELIGSFVNAEFSEKPTNGEVVAWVTREVIDRNRITGTQNRDRVFAWKKGMKESQEIFEDHAWSNERYLRVFTPEVDENGTIRVEIKSGDKVEKKEFKI